MLRLEPEPLGRLPEEHLADADPIPVILAGQQRLELVPPPVRRRPVLQPWRQHLQQAEGHVPAREAEPLEQEAAREADAALVGAPGLEAVAREALDVAEALPRGLVEVLARRDFFEEPGFDEGAAGEHDGIDAGGADVRFVVGVRVAVAVADEVHAASAGAGGEVPLVGRAGRVGEGVAGGVVGADDGGALGDVGPVGGFCVALLAGTAVQGDGGDAGGAQVEGAGLGPTEGEAADELGGGGVVVLCAGADLGGDGDGPGDSVHAAQDLLQAARGVEEGGAGALAVDEVDGAAAVEVDGAEAGAEGGEDLGGFEGGGGLVGGDLGAELDVLGVVIAVWDGGYGVVFWGFELGLVGLYQQRKPAIYGEGYVKRPITSPLLPS